VVGATGHMIGEFLDLYTLGLEYYEKIHTLCLVFNMYFMPFSQLHLNKCTSSTLFLPPMTLQMRIWVKNTFQQSSIWYLFFPVLIFPVFFA